MSTLETQYKIFLSENPDSKFTFEDWRREILEPHAKIIMTHTEYLIELQKMTQKLLEEEKLRQNK
jgi:hypothetical protein